MNKAFHETERRFPEQCAEFKAITDKMYQIHLDKNYDYCVAPNTPILTGDLRWIPANSIEIGMTLVGFDERARMGNERRMFRPSVVQRASSVNLPSYRLTMADGTVLICSDTHPWLVQSGATSRWLETRNLQSADKYQNPSKIVRAMDTWEELTSYEAGYLAAALNGEGWLSQLKPYKVHGGSGFIVGFAQRPNEMLKMVRGILDDMGIKYTEKRYQTVKRNDLRQLLMSGKRHNWIKLLGEIRPRRLMRKLDLNLGMIYMRPVAVVSTEHIGDTGLIALGTSTRTFLADGFASHNSPMNILATGRVGTVTRIWDKVARLMNLSGFDIRTGSFTGEKEAKNESIEDTLFDLANYAIIALIHRRGKWGKEKLEGETPKPVPEEIPLPPLINSGTCKNCRTGIYWIEGRGWFHRVGSTFICPVNKGGNEDQFGFPGAKPDETI